MEEVRFRANARRFGTSLSFRTWRRNGPGCGRGLMSAARRSTCSARRRRHAGHGRHRCPAGPCRRLEEIGGGRKTNAALSAGRPCRSAGSSTMPPNSPPANQAGAAAMTGSSSIRQNMAVGRPGSLAAGRRSAGPDRQLPSLLDADSPPGAHRLCAAHVGAGDPRIDVTGAGGTWRDHRMRRNGGSARKPAICSSRPRSSPWSRG